jgi:hypothetical protein
MQVRNFSLLIPPRSRPSVAGVVGVVGAVGIVGVDGIVGIPRSILRIPVETEIAAIESKSHHPSNPWCTNTNGRLSNPQWNPFISDGHRRWEITFAVSGFARRFRERRLTVFSFRFSVRLGIRVRNLESRS